MAANSVFDTIHYLRDLIVAASTLAGSRVYMSVAPQDAVYPHVVMDIVSSNETPTQDDGSGVDTYRIQFDIWAKGSAASSAFGTATDLESEIRGAISRMMGREGQAEIDGIQEVNYLTDYIPENDLQRITRDYMVRVKFSAA